MPMLLLYVAVALLVLPLQPSSCVHNPSSGATKKPNFVFILTDDQDAILTSNASVHVRAGGYGTMGGLEVMSALRKRVLEKGASFKNFFVNVSIFSAMYACLNNESPLLIQIYAAKT